MKRERREALPHDHHRQQTSLDRHALIAVGFGLASFAGLAMATASGGDMVLPALFTAFSAMAVATFFLGGELLRHLSFSEDLPETQDQAVPVTYRARHRLRP